MDQKGQLGKMGQLFDGIVYVEGLTLIRFYLAYIYPEESYIKGIYLDGQLIG